MLLNLKGELTKKAKDPVKAIIETIGCSDKTARNKLNGITDFTIPEALKIRNTYFDNDDFEIEWLFRDSDRQPTT